MVLLPQAREEATILGTPNGRDFMAAAAIRAFCPPPMEMTASNNPSAYKAGMTAVRAFDMVSILWALSKGPNSSQVIP